MRSAIKFIVCDEFSSTVAHHIYSLELSRIFDPYRLFSIMDSATDTEVHFDPSKKPADDAVTLRLNRTESSRSQRRRSSEASKNRKTGCCPKLFERASGSWWNPKFNSPIIEQQFLKNCFSQGIHDMLAGKIITKLLLHICVHVMGTHIFFMSQVRTRSTFMKIGEAIVARRQHKKEKQVKELTIHALMPTTIAKELLSRSETEGGRKQTIFRPFYMNRMEDVSILFADIAGFTQMSANKSAETLVGLLNDLFGRFDILCVKTSARRFAP
ncbi:putative adenylate cyclase type 9 [Apostichopus japonicus]|uniref:adenylate cyclase n=1 Tax=Stichopus japonicus TaxID=307972 RepID=A0A2G8LGA8_STIJA|nr:putative adenylate cyclase type 9 [Apostichopus japonicus]